MSGYILIAESIFFKRDKLTCINVYNELSAFMVPAEFRFDLAVFCGPNWSVGEHNLSVKAVANGNREVHLGTAKVNIPHDKFVYNAFLNDIAFRMDQSVTDLTIVVSDGDKEIMSRTYPVRAMFAVQQKPNAPQEQQSENTDEKQEETTEKNKKDKKKK